LSARDEPALIKGGLAVDDRGSLSFVNDFDLGPARRFYVVRNHERGFVRAWHAHREEQKFITAVEGSVLLCCVRVDDWDDPSRELPIDRFVLSAQAPSVLVIPGGYAHGFMTLTEGTAVMVFSSATLEESLDDDIRFPARHWDPWHVEER
jgi:dTDP-4-dehydrorhamnose 3,5-epimerase-like enzyme